MQDLARFFAGHFPSHPVLPGVAQLALVQEALARREGREVWLAELRAVRFRRPVRPGEELEVRLAAGDEGEARFELRTGEERVSDGVVRSGNAQAPLEVASSGLPLPETFPELESLIPHRSPALLLRRLLAHDAGALTALAAVPRDSPFVRAGFAPAFLAIEMAAQAAAALQAFERGEGEPRLGYLVGIRDAAFLQAWLPVETPLRVEVRAGGGAQPLARYALSVAAGDALVATGTISTYLT